MPSSSIRQLDIESVLSRISVRPPYFALRNITSDNNSVMADFSREQPISGDFGPVTTAEAGRHLAILGSVSLSHFFPEKEQTVYLAKRATFERLDITPRKNQVFTGRITETSVEGKCGFATAELIADETAIMKFDIDYMCLGIKVFSRLFGKHKRDMRKSTRIQQDCGTTPGLADNRNNPYSEIQTILPDNSCKDQGILSSHPQIITPEMCNGHFPMHPSLPVAILMSTIDYNNQDLICCHSGRDSTCCILKTIICAENLAFAGDRYSVHSRVLESGDDTYRIYTEARLEDNKIIGSADTTYQLFK
jgi:hypothetical protein